MNEALQTRIDATMHNLDARPRSEKLILLAVLVAGLVLVFLSLALDPLTADIDSLQAQTANVQRQISAQQTAYAGMVAASQEDPTRFADERLRAISNDLATLDREITNLAGDLITPREMTQILTTVLGQYSGLELVRFENKPAVPLRTGLQTDESNQDDSNNQNLLANNAVDGQVYEHGLTLQFSGDFFTTLKYLRFLEGLTGSFFWDSVSFQQSAWPNADVTLEIHTLSTEEGFIGV